MREMTQPLLSCELLPRARNQEWCAATRIITVVDTDAVFVHHPRADRHHSAAAAGEVQAAAIDAVIVDIICTIISAIFIPATLTSYSYRHLPCTCPSASSHCHLRPSPIAATVHCAIIHHHHQRTIIIVILILTLLIILVIIIFLTVVVILSSVLYACIDISFIAGFSTCRPPSWAGRGATASAEVHKVH